MQCISFLAGDAEIPTGGQCSRLIKHFSQTQCCCLVKHTVVGISNVQVCLLTLGFRATEQSRVVLLRRQQHSPFLCHSPLPSCTTRSTSSQSSLAPTWSHFPLKLPQPIAVPMNFLFMEAILHTTFPGKMKYRSLTEYYALNASALSIVAVMNT